MLGSNIILRLEDDDIFDHLPEPLRKSLMAQLRVSQWSRDQFQVKTISDDEKYLPHYLERIDAIDAGVGFLLMNLPPNHAFRHGIELIKYLNDIAKDCKDHLRKLKDDKDAFLADFQNSLANYVEYILEILQSELKFSKQQAMHLLGRAEEFALAKKPRPTVCSITTVNKARGEFLVNIDKPESSFNAAVKEDLVRIKNQDDDLPEWFMILDEYEQFFIRKLLDDIDLDTELDDISLSSKLRIIPALSNYATHTLTSYVKAFNEPAPKVIVHAPERRASHAASRDVSKQTQRVRDTHAVRNLQKMVDDAAKAKQLELEQTMPPERAVVRPRSEAEKRRSRRKAIIVPILYQTLITPLISPDSALQEDKERAVKTMRKKLNKRFRAGKDKVGKTRIKYVLYTTNHPLNYGKFVTPTRPGSPTARTVNILVDIANNFPATGNDKKLLEQTCRLLDLYTNSKAKIFNSYRELYLCSLEKIVVTTMGGASMGSCVSGKDREALVTLHTDMMQVFFDKHGRLPPLVANTPDDARDMKKFANLFAKAYCSKHHHAVADLNAPGSFGIKTPEMYLPDHLQKGIKRWYKKRDGKDVNYEGLSSRNTLQDGDRLATNNEIPTITHMGTGIASRLCSIGTKANVDNAWQKPDRKALKIYCSQKERIQEFIDIIAGSSDEGSIRRYHIECNKQREKLGSYAHSFLTSRFAIAKLKQEMAGLEVLLQLLENQSPLSTQQKAIILNAIFTNSKSAKLQEYISEDIGFTNVKNSLEVIFNYLHDSSPNKEGMAVATKRITQAINNIDEKKTNVTQAEIIISLDDFAQPPNDTAKVLQHFRLAAPLRLAS